MDAWSSAECQGQFEAATEDFCWQDSFISELSLVSPTYVAGSGVANFEAPADLRLVFVQTCGAAQALELNLTWAESVAVPVTTDLDQPKLVVERDRVALTVDARQPPMIGRELRWRRLGRAEAEKNPTVDPRYGRAFPEQ